VRRGSGRTGSRLVIPRDVDNAVLDVAGRAVTLTNLRKVFWPQGGTTKADLLQYYADVAPSLLPHLRHRAMVMKRYPNGVAGDYFFMKRVPTPHPDWIETCVIGHHEGDVAYPMVQDLPSLLWVVNLGCIDLNQWYARCDDVRRPDYVHFDLDPGEGAAWDSVLKTATELHEILEGLGMPALIKTSGSRGAHVYVPIVRGPAQGDVWTVAQIIAQDLGRRRPDLVTTEYRRAKRPRARVLVDYNQNAWGHTLASIYSVRPRPVPSVSTPVTWREVARGVRTDDFTIENVPARLRRLGDLWAPLLDTRGRVDLSQIGRTVSK
jgi:bifunctional non-homologous end joining protein LigD